MSDDFHAFCCSHDPAFNLTDFDVGRDEVEPMIRRMRQDSPHSDCNLLIGRYSGSLIDIGCPGSLGTDRGFGEAFGCASGHKEIKWIDARWLKLALALLGPTGSIQSGPGAEELDAVTRWCWTPERIHRLRRILTSEP